MKFETLASGYGLLEAPRVDAQNRLYFADIPNGGIYRRSPDGRIETLIPKRRGVGGMVFNRSGGLVLSGRTLIHWDEKSGKSREIFSQWEGKPFGGLNDLTADAHGSIYVGSLNFDPLSNNKPVPGSLFRVDPPGRAVKLWDGIEVTNGLGLSPDGKLLYHCDSTTGAVWAYDVNADRSVKDRRIFAKMPAGWPDGMAVDAEGELWVAAVRAGEVVRFKSDGTVRERIAVGAKMVTSLVFGGADLMDLYVVTADNRENPDAKGTIFKARTEVPGLKVPPAQF